MTAPLPVDGDLTALVRIADKAIDKFAAPLAKFVGETLGEPVKNAIGVVVSDPLAFYRIEKIAERLQRTKEKLEARGIKNIRPIPPKLAVELLDGGSLEDEPDLQELWDTLLTNALDPTFRQRIPPVYIAILKELSAVDAVLLKCIVQQARRDDPSTSLSLRSYCLHMSRILAQHRNGVLGRFSTRDLIVAIQNLTRLRLMRIDSEIYNTSEDGYVDSVLFSPYPLALAFAAAAFDFAEER